MPVTLGHEFSGIIEEVGRSVTRFRPGDRVVLEPIIYDGTCASCRAGRLNCCVANGFVGISGYGGGMAEHVVLPEQYVTALPEGISLKVGGESWPLQLQTFEGLTAAALIEPLSVAHRAIAAADIGLGSNAAVLVVGGGPVGLAVILVLAALGVSRIVLSEPAAGRRALGQAFGASLVLDPGNCDDVRARCAEECGDAGEGPDVAFDCAGVQASLDLAVRAVRPKGLVVNVAVWEKMPKFPVNALLFKEKRFVGTAAPEHADFVGIMALLQAGRLQPEDLVTKFIGLQEVEKEGFKTLVEDKDAHAKILVEIGGGD
jgi:threonine dehydrogenase-like Zn-dependent dehydrogenase